MDPRRKSSVWLGCVLGALAVHAAADQTPRESVPAVPAVVEAVEQAVWFDAVAENHYATVKGMIDGGFDVNAPQRVTELTALHFAVGGGAGETAAMLLWNGAGVDTRDSVDLTALHHACELGQAKMAEMLLAHGADVNAVGGVHGYTPLHLAVQNDHADLAGALLDAGADLSAREGHGATPLHFAVLHGRVAAARRLIDRGADVADPTTRDGYTALHIAALRDRAACAVLLLQQGAPLDARDHDGFTPLQRAREFKANNVIAVLLEAETAE